MAHFRFTYIVLLFLHLLIGFWPAKGMNDDELDIWADEMKQMGPAPQESNPMDLFFIHACSRDFNRAESFLMNASDDQIITSRNDEGKNATGDNALHIAIKCKKQNWIGLLLKFGKLRGDTNFSNDTPLDTAITQSDIPVAVIEQLLNAGSAITRHTVMRVLTQLRTDLLEPIFRNSQLFDAQLTKLSNTEPGWLLFESSYRASPHGITYALNKDGVGYINNRDGNSGRTPLHSAVVAGCNGCVTLLLKHGANPLIQDRKGQTPLQLARDAVRLLLPPLGKDMPEGEKIKEWYAPIIEQLQAAQQIAKSTEPSGAVDTPGAPSSQQNILAAASSTVSPAAQTDVSQINQAEKTVPDISVHDSSSGRLNTPATRPAPKTGTHFVRSRWCMGLAGLSLVGISYLYWHREKNKKDGQGIDDEPSGNTLETIFV